MQDNTYSDFVRLHRRHSKNLLDVSAVLRQHIDRSRERGWKSVSISFQEAEAATEIINGANTAMTGMFDSSIRALKVVDKNSEIIDQVIVYPLQVVFRSYVAGKIDTATLSNCIAKVFSAKRMME